MGKIILSHLGNKGITRFFGVNTVIISYSFITQVQVFEILSPFKLLEVSSELGEYIYMKKCSVRAPARAHSTFEKSKNHDFGVFYCNLEVNLQNILARSARGSARAPKIFSPSCAPKKIDAFCTVNEGSSSKTRF